MIEMEMEAVMGEEATDKKGEKTTTAAKAEPAAKMDPAMEAHAAAHAKAKTDPDAPLPGEVFVRHCPSCGDLKMTADQSGKTPCRACLARKKHAAKAAPETEPEPGTVDRRGELAPLADAITDAAAPTGTLAEPGPAPRAKPGKG